MKKLYKESEDLKSIARCIRGKIVELSHKTQTPHLGSSLSCVDILVAAYWGALEIDPETPQSLIRDRLILSKGHASTTLYVALAYRGFFPVELLDTYTKSGSSLVEHPIFGSVPGIEATSGSLGHGLSLGLGMALAGRIQERSYRVFVVMSDGECNEGSVWEAAMLAPAQRVDNLVAVIDYNKWQATGRSHDTMAISPLKEKWEAFGWNAYEVDGHDLNALVEVLRNSPTVSGKPTAIVAHTVKGKGVSFMEDDNNWHYRIPSASEIRRAKLELELL